MTVATDAVADVAPHDHEYSELLNFVNMSFAAASSGCTHLFTTGVLDLNEVYLDQLNSARQFHNCHACRAFLRRYGGLVRITKDGDTVPAMWTMNPSGSLYRSAFAALEASVKRARVTGVFLAKDPNWGTPRTGEWTHMAVTAPAHLVYREGALTVDQAMAAFKERYRTVATALTELPASALDQAIRMFDANVLARSERFIEPVRWLRELHDRPAGRRGENILWHAIAAAPEGFCHPKTSVVGPLLSDIAAGLPFTDIKTRFDAMMYPLSYQRPQVAPRAGNIHAAELLVEKLGIARSLERRFAGLHEVQTIWRPKMATPAPVSGGVFGHLAPKGVSTIPSVNIPTQVMTWEKFARSVLPATERIELAVPNRGNFETYVTAVHADAPLIFKWDNPVSGYVYAGGSMALQWNLRAGAWTPVVAISPRPHEWTSSDQSYLGSGCLLALEGAVDCRTDQGNALFPEYLKSELYSVRSTIEAYSKTAVIARLDGPLACGLRIGKEIAMCTLRVFSAGAWNVYKIDRWD